MIEIVKYIREKVDLSLMPSASDIKEEDKRHEYHEDYKRLVGRCGRAVMNATLNLYLIEQQIESGEIVKPFHKINFLGYRNTSEIIARFVEKGLADYYLTDKPMSPTIITYDKKSQPISIAFIHSDTITYRSKRGGLPTVFALEARSIQSAKEKATLVSPKEIRSVFARIDTQYT